MEIEHIINYILKNQRKFPGEHLKAQPRTNSAYKPLEPNSQMQLIWKATVEYLNEKLNRGTGVNIQGFGAFTFDVETKLPSPASINPSAGDIHSQRLERKHLHKNQPVFVPDPSFQRVLQRYHGKNQIEKPASQHSVYQKGFNMVFCNPVPIAQACYLHKNVVRDAHKGIFAAIKDLTQLGYSLKIPFNFAVLLVNNKSLEVRFKGSFRRTVNAKEYERQMRKSDDPCATFWKTTMRDKWRSSVLSTLWGNPDPKVNQMNEKTLALKIMSLDMASNSRPTTAL